MEGEIRNIDSKPTAEVKALERRLGQVVHSEHAQA